MTVTVAYGGQLGTATGSGATLGITASAAPVGSLVAVSIGANTGSGSISGVADTGGNTWQVAWSQVNGATFPCAAIWWTKVTNGTLGTITISFNATVPTSSAASAHCWTASGVPAGWGWQVDRSSQGNGNGTSTTPSDSTGPLNAAGVRVSALVGITTTATILDFNGSSPSSAGYVERSRTVGGTVTTWSIENIGITGTGVFCGPDMSASIAWQMLGAAFFVGPQFVQYGSNNSTAGGVNPTLVVTMGAATSASNLLVAMCASNGGTDFTATGWTSAGVSGGNRLVAVLWKVGDAQTAYTFTRTGGASGEGLDIVVWEFSGIDLVNPIDLHVRTDSAGAQPSPGALTGGSAAANTLRLAWFALDGGTAPFLSPSPSWVNNWPTDNGGAPTQFHDPTSKVTVYEWGQFATIPLSVAPSVSGWAGSLIWTGAVVTLIGATVPASGQPFIRQAATMVTPR